MTTRAKHTPGPWEIHDLQGNPQLVHEKNGAQELVVDCESVFREEEEDIANARLIAAAPEMAELLEKCLWKARDKVGRAYRTYSPYSAEAEAANAAFEEIRAVLAKAGVLDGGTG